MLTLINSLIAIVLAIYMQAANAASTPDLLYLQLEDNQQHELGGYFLHELHEQRHRFKPAPTGISLNRGFQHWFSFSLDSVAAHDAIYFFEIDFPNIDEVFVHVRYGSGEIISSVVGDDVSHTSWPFNSRLPTIPLRLGEATATHVYMLLAATGQPAVLPINILTAEELSEREQQDYLWYGFFYGAISILVAFNFMLFAATRIKAYLAYVIYLGCFLILQLSITGVGQQLIWPALSGFTTLFALVMLALVNATMTYFVIHFLDIPTLYPRLKLPLLSLIVVSLVPIVFLGIIEYIHVQEFQHLLAVISITILITVSSYCFYKGSRPALYLLIGYSVLFAGILLTLIRVNGIYDSGFLGKHLLEIAILFEAIILSLGLADRINELKDEKRAVERSARINQENFTQQLITAHESEKRHFGAILHDDIGHRLLNIQQIIHSLLKSDSKQQPTHARQESLVKLHASANQLMEEIQHLSKSSHPHLLEQLGLEAAINSLMNHSFAGKGVDYSCHISIGIGSDVIDQHLYRITQECISNTLKHANAAEVLLRIGHSTQNEIFMLYKDDGKGFHAEEINNSTGFGLISITERVKLMKGTLHWNTETAGHFSMHISNIRYEN